MTPKEKAALTRQTNKAEENWGKAHDAMVATALNPEATEYDKLVTAYEAEQQRLVYQVLLRKRLGFDDPAAGRRLATVTPIG